jgi:hypothetical protein
VILLEHRHPGAGAYGYFSFIVLDLSGEDPQKGGFPRTVGSYDAIAVARGELERHIFKKGALAEAKRKFADGYHKRIVPVIAGNFKGGIVFWLTERPWSRYI